MERGVGLCALSNPLALPHKGEVIVNSHKVEALFDSGSKLSMVECRYVLPRQWLKTKTCITCVHGDVRAYESARCFICHGGILKKLVVAVLPNPPCAGILGRDWSDDKSSAVLISPYSKLGLVTDGNPPSQVVSTPCTQPVERDMGDHKEDGELPGTLQTNTSSVRSSPEREVSPPLEVSPDPLSDLSFQFRQTPASFKREQWNDSLKFAKNVVVFVNGQRTSQPMPQGPHFVLENDLLYRVSEHEGGVRKLLLIPQAFRRQVCELAHAHLLGGHLGNEKTLERIKLRFYWLGINEEVRRFCVSCPECQLWQIPRRDRAPLVPLPLIDVPFERIGVDIVGPLEPSARGHKYILVLVDYATRYPEAVPLRSANSKAIARVLMEVFARVRVPKEVLTDQGTPFTSETFKEIAKLLKIKHLRTAVYHPQTNGLVERFNQTLKQMLRKVVSGDGRNWDQLLPLVLFAYREVPQASTG
uniref:Gypsy retrotransposon integrase-like protein 1 n=1 Tax=Erpetoichthys calabaricus TaxID=27687 RepID=A0A8C4XBU5_ERPCA